MNLRIKNLVNPQEAPIRVFAFDSSVSDKALTCGQPLENHMICSAGGTNIFLKFPKQMLRLITKST